ncbi:MAG: NADH-quinone oxidoreductase subunit J [Holosporales bacterium]
MTSLLFYGFSIVLLFAALRVVFANNPVHAVLNLILCFIASAGLFILQGAELIAMLLALVYVGAVAVLFLFVVMMLDIVPPEEHSSGPMKIRVVLQTIAGMLLYAGSVIFLSILLFSIWRFAVQEFSGAPLSQPLASGVAAFFSFAGGIALSEVWKGKFFPSLSLKASRLLPWAAVWAGFIMVGLSQLLWSSFGPQTLFLTGKGAVPFEPGSSTTLSVGKVLYTSYAPLFQLGGLVLLVAMIGAIVLTHRRRPGVKRQDIAAQVSRQKADTVKLVNVPLRGGVDV